MSDAKTPIGKVAAYVKEQIPAQVEKAVSEIELPVAKDGADGIGLNLKNWEASIHREGSVVQHNIGQAYKALVDTNEEPGHSSDWERVGSAGFRWTGVKNADFAYQDGDLYIDGGTTFLWNGTKGHMIAQRGKNGRDGQDGSNGKDGKSAPEIVDMTIVGKDLVAVFSDGNMCSVEMPVIKEMAGIQKQLSWLEEQMLAFENIKAPIKGYEGIWEHGTSYSKGDLVTFGKGLYLCFEADSNSLSIDPDKWVKIAGAGGGGGGGGGAGGISRMSTLLVDALLNMQGKRIQGLGDPRPGTIGKRDAVNKGTMEQAIAAGALYQGIYTVETDSPDLRAKTDRPFTPLAAGDEINKPNAAAPGITTPATHIVTWHNWGGNGFDTFAVTTTAPKKFEVRMSDGTIHDFNIPAGVYADEAALAAAMDLKADPFYFTNFHVYVNGADCHIGVETVAPLYCTAIGGETGNAFPAVTPGANNTVLNTYNWIVQTRDENKPEALPAGIPGLPAGTVVKNSDVLQWSSAKNGFEVISGSSLTQSFSDQRYWQVNGNNMAWSDQAYSKGAVVYHVGRNAWFSAQQNITVGSPEPGSLAAGAMWRKINSTYGSTVFFGRGDFDAADTSALNNWGMPVGTYPPGQQPLNGDTYFDVLSGSTTDFTVTQHPPSFTLSGTFDEATQDLGYEFWGARYDIQTWPADAPAIPPAIGSGWHGTTLGAGLAILTGTFAGEQIRPNCHYFVIWSGDPDADHGGWVLLQRENAPVTPPANWNKWTTTTIHPQNIPDTVAGLTIYGFERNVEIKVQAGATVGLNVMLAKNLPNTSWRMVGELIDLTDGTICEFFVTNIAGSNKPEITPVNVLPSGTPGIDEIIVHHSAGSGIFITGKLNANGVGRTYKLELTSEDFDLGLVTHGDGVEHEGGRTSGFYALSKYPAQLIPMQLIGAKASNADFAKGTMLRIPANVIAGHIYQVAAVVRGTYDNESDYFVTQLGISKNGGNTIPHNKTFSVNKSGWYESTINSLDIWKADVTGPVEFDLTCISYSGGVQFRSTNMSVIDMGTG